MAENWLLLVCLLKQVWEEPAIVLKCPSNGMVTSEGRFQLGWRCYVPPKGPLPLVSNGIKSRSLGPGSASQQQAWPNRVGLVLFPSSLRRGPPSLSSRWLRRTPAQPVGPQWAVPGGPWPSPGLTRDPQAGGEAESSFPPSFSSPPHP